MAWRVDQIGLSGVLTGTWLSLRSRTDYEFQIVGMRGRLPVESDRSVLSLGFDAAAFVKFGPLVFDAGISPSWSLENNALRVHGLLGIAIPVGKNCELRILGGFRQFRITTTDSANPLTSGSSGFGFEIDLSTFLGKTGALVMATQGTVMTASKDVNPSIALGGRLLMSGDYDFVKDNEDSELALDRAKAALEKARKTFSKDFLKSEIERYTLFAPHLNTTLDIIERSVRSLNDPTTMGQMLDATKTAATYSRDYAKNDSVREEASQILRQAHTMVSNLRIQLAKEIASDSFGILHDIKSMDRKIRAPQLERFQAILNRLVSDQMEVLNELQGMFHAMRCLQGRGVNCDNYF